MNSIITVKPFAHIFVLFSVYFLVTNATSQPSQSLQWMAPVEISSNLPGNSRFPFISARRPEGAVIVWAQALEETSLNEDEIFFREYDGKQWLPVQNISNTATYSTFPVVINDQGGIIRAFWLEKLSNRSNMPGPRGFSDVFYTYRKNSVWSQPSSIYHTELRQGLSVSGMDLEIDGDNTLHLLWMDPGNPSTLYSRRKAIPAGLAHWTPPKQIFQGGMADMTIDGKGRLHVAFIYTIGTSNAKGYFPTNPQRINDLFYTYSLNGGQTWADRILVHDSKTEASFFPKIIVDLQRKVHILWAKDNDGNLFPDDILHSFSSDGIHWSQPISVSRLNAGTSFPPAVVLDSKNRIHIVWWWTPFFGSNQNNFLYYARWENGQWSEPSRLFLNASSPSMCIDAQGIIHMVWINVYKVSGDQRKARILYSQAPTNGQDQIPTTFRLYQNFPNPFRRLTEIRYWLPEPEQVNLRIFNTAGKEVDLLVNEISYAGLHTIPFDGSKLPNGIYFYQLEMAGYRMMKKMIILR